MANDILRLEPRPGPARAIGRLNPFWDDTFQAKLANRSKHLVAMPIANSVALHDSVARAHLQNGITSCARAVSGQVTAVPPRRATTWRRLIASPEAQEGTSWWLKIAHWKGGQ